MPHTRIASKAASVLIVISILYFGYKVINSVVSEPAQGEATRVTMREILSFVMKYHKNYQKWPVGKQDELLRFTNDSAPDGYSACFPNKIMMREGRLTDAWGTPFFVTISDHRFSLISAGPDRATNTTDDITGWIPADKDGAALDDVDITIVPL